MSGFSAIKTFDRYSDDSAPQTGAPAATGVWAMRVTKFDAGAKLGFAEDNLRTIRALSHYRLKPGKGVEPFEVYITGNVAFEYVTSPLDYDVFDGSLSPQSSTDVGANQVVVGPDASGAAQTGNPVLVGGVDVGAVVRRLKVDANGQPFVVPVSTQGNPLYGNNASATAPTAGMFAAAWDGANTRILASDVKGRLVTPGDSNRPTYTLAFGQALNSAAPLPLFALEAGASKTVKIHRIAFDLEAVQTTAGFLEIVLVRTTGASSGPAGSTPVTEDPNDGAFSGILRHGGAIASTPGIASFDISAPSWIRYGSLWIPAVGGGPVKSSLVWDHGGTPAKALSIAPGTANGLFCFIHLGSNGAGVTGPILVEMTFTEE